MGRPGGKGGEHADGLTRRELAKATVKAGLATSAAVWVSPQILERRPRTSDSGESSTIDNDERFDDESDNDFDHESDNGCDDDATDDSTEEGTADVEKGTAEARCAARCNSDTRNAELHRIAIDEPAS